MKTIEIFYSDYCNPSETLRCESPPMDVDFKMLAEYYSSLGEKHKKNFDKFLEYWSNEGFEKLFHPAARAMTMPLAVAIENFGSELLQTNESVDEVCMFVWTIGDQLETTASRIMSDKSEMMTAFLLDVAGSIALYDMHDVLLGWLKSDKAANKNKYINGEYYPGMGSMRQDLMEKVAALGATEDIIGVGASGSSLLHPRKSQCSFIALGAAEHEVVVKSQPCEPCLGKRCLYHQLGGCHMMHSQFESFEETVNGAR